MRRIITITGAALAVLLVAGVAWAGFGTDDSTTTTSGQSNGQTTTSTTDGAIQTDDDLGGNGEDLRFVCDPSDGFDQELATIQLPAGQEFEIEVENEDGQTVCKVDFKADDNPTTTSTTNGANPNDDDLGGDGEDLRFVCDPSDGFDQELATIQLPAGQEFEIEVENEHGQTVCKVEIGDDDNGRHGGDDQSGDDRGGDDNSGPGSGDDDSGHHGGGNSGESGDD